MRPQTFSCRARPGFTLIELLVVVSIVSILMALLLPALTESRLLAKRVKCQANQRQISAGHLAYGQDNRGWFPTVWPTSQAGIVPANNRNPLETGYWGADARLFLCPDSEFTGTNVGYAPARWWAGLNMLITSYRYIATSGVSTQTWMWYGMHPGGSGLQTTRVDDRVSTCVPKEEFAGRLTADPVYPTNRRYVHPPDAQPLMMDGRSALNPNWSVYTSLGQMSNNHATLKGMNIVFLDGHAQWGDQTRDPIRMYVGYGGNDSGWLRW